jgi:CRISPR-associated protein Cmr1
MIKLEASFKIVTPLFMSGADREWAELRAASIRGVLRFWWRALALGKDQYNFSWSKVRDAEFDLFGSASHGQSRVHLSLTKSNESEKRCRSGSLLKDDSDNIIGPGARYLGYGVVQPYDKKDQSGKITEKMGSSLRPYLDASLEGVLSLYLRPTTATSKSMSAIDEVDLLEEAIMAMGLLGGLGSRSRRGFGSFNLMELKRDGELRYSRNEESYFDSLEKLFQKHARGLEVPEYTAFSRDSRTYLLKKGKDPLKLLDEVGQEMQMYRCWGLRDKSGRYMVNDKPAEQNFKDDHDNMRNAIFSTASEHPRRIAFGLPHNYHFTSLTRNLTVLSDNYERRASPLFLHIHELSNNDYAAVASIFPTMFLPEGENILIKRDDGDKQSLPLQRKWLKVLTDFVEGDVYNRAGHKRFPDLKVIWPKAEEVSA